MPREDEKPSGEMTRREEIEALLFDHLPFHRNLDGDKLDYKKLWKALGMTRQGLNFWFTRERISMNKVTKLTKLRGSTLTADMLLPYTVADE